MFNSINYKKILEKVAEYTSRTTTTKKEINLFLPIFQGNCVLAKFNSKYCTKKVEYDILARILLPINKNRKHTIAFTQSVH